MKQVTPINSAPPLPNWQAAADGLRGIDLYEDDFRGALCALLGLDQESKRDAIAAALSVQRSPAISVYDRKYTAHIYPEPGVHPGQVYEALRDYAAQHATPDPAMVAIRNREILKTIDAWLAEGPPSPEDMEFWRQFDADLARAKRGGGSLEKAAELEMLDAVKAMLDHWREHGVTGEQATADLERVLGGQEKPAAAPWTPTYQDWATERDNAGARADEVQELRRLLAYAEQVIRDLTAKMQRPAPAMFCPSCGQDRVAAARDVCSLCGGPLTAKG